jgi:hypothetical protein
MSKNILRVAFLSSGSGTSVTSMKGPTILGMKEILCSPKIISMVKHLKIYFSHDIPSFDHMSRI